MTLELESKASQVVDWGGGGIGHHPFLFPRLDLRSLNSRSSLIFFTQSLANVFCLFPHSWAWSQAALQIEMFQMTVHLRDNTLTICKQANDTYSH